MNRNPVEPWRTDRWVTSRHNFDPSITVPPRQVELHDITVRDGEECADLAFSVDDKVRIAEALALVGIPRMEMFLTVPGWLEAVRAILARKLPQRLVVTWDPGRTERAIDLGVRDVMVWYRIGEEYQQHVSRRPRSQLLDETLRAVEQAVATGCEVNLFMPETTRATLDVLHETVVAAKAAGAKAFTVVDSQGIARPRAIGLLVSKIREWTGLGVEVHCHNDFGLAVANVLAAYEAGATRLHVAVNSVGYRAGNAALEEVVMALEAIYGVDTGVRLEMLPWLSGVVSDVTGIEPGYFKAIVGSGAFAYEQWGATDLLERGGARPIAFPFEPEVIGRKPTLAIGKWSDLGAIAKKLADYGLTASADQMAHMLRKGQTAGVAYHRPLTDDEFLAIAYAEGAVRGEP